MRVQPLTARERTELYRILSASTRGRPQLHPRQRAALDAYAELIASPPFSESEVVSAARAVIKVWSEVARPVVSAKKRLIPAVLLDLEEPPFVDLTIDLLPSMVIEAATEVVMARSPLYDFVEQRSTEVISYRPLTGAG
jgi:hypothetical protein